MTPGKLFTYALWAGAAYAVYYVAKTASANSSTGATFGANGAFSQDTWTQDFGVSDPTSSTDW